ncbi:sigma-70 family RNA polymerase sigma factor [Methylobacterium sp. E-005]|uniref:sigma-70 family RNA polymerase sigma factor n=1 Tax=Methylobacterium sp. E-005 TaxID=2836549 RepID=UPI001FBB18B7|nr:sigma-70 family RNA polymerase sigma factor [Methylobacterium sp. E-005]MCJ2085841.1 sigma-70 family RNA polymerase sigma factor [Methylobacterium sp. E-005]
MPEAVLPEPVRQHLGSLIAAAYGLEEQGDAEASAPKRFADLLAKLDVAVGAARSREEAEFQRLLLAAVPPLRRFAISLCRDRSATEDLVQETLFRAWKNRGSFQPGTNLEAWTFTILRNFYYTGQRKHREVQDEDGSYAARMVARPEQSGRLDLQDVSAALDRLAPAMREALVLISLENLSYEEAAAVIGCQLGTVKSRVWRARDQLARMLGYSGAEIGTDAVMLSANAR